MSRVLIPLPDRDLDVAEVAVPWRLLTRAGHRVEFCTEKGGHAPGMRQYLGSDALQRRVATFFASGRPVGAICHGVLVLAHSIDPATGKDVLHDRRTPCLAKCQDRKAYFLTAWELGRYYRTYPAFAVDDGHYVSARRPATRRRSRRSRSGAARRGPSRCRSARSAS